MRRKYTKPNSNYDMKLKVSVLVDGEEISKIILCKRYNEILIGRAICDLKGVHIHVKDGVVYISRAGYINPTKFKTLSHAYYYFYEFCITTRKVKVEVVLNEEN